VNYLSDDPMSEKIKQFMIQSGTDISGKWMSIDSAEKFAEMIIQECIECIQLTTARDPQNTVQYKQSVGHIHRIREHFGVEE
jgi:hypothetical protein